MKLFATTALATALATSALAYDNNATSTATNVSMETSEMQQGDLIRSRDITGGNIYTLAGEAAQSWDSEWTYDQMRDNLNDIGEIEDLVLSSDGQLTGIVAEVGGFLDIGDKHVVIEVNDVKLVPIDDQTYAYVTRMTEEQLEELPAVDEGFWN